MTQFKVCKTTMDVAALNRSYNSLKGKLTTALESAAKSVTFSEMVPPTDSMLRQLIKHVEVVEAKYLKEERVIEAMMDLVNDDDEGEKELSSLTKKQKFEINRRDESLENLLSAIARIEAALKPEGRPRRAAVEAHDHDRPQRCKANSDLKPKVLNRTYSPIEFSQWLESYASYYAASHMEQANLLEQHAYFFSCVDAQLSSVLRPKVNRLTEILMNDGDLDHSCESLLREEFQAAHPLFNRRLQFFQAVQPKGQSVTDWMAHLDQLGDQADLANVGVDELYVLVTLSGCTDHKIKEKLMEVRDPTKKKLHTEAAHLQVVSRKMGVPEPVRAHAISSGNSGQRDRKPYPNPKLEAHYQACRASGTCMRCDGKMPTGQGERHECPLKNTVCSKCSRSGHSDKHCFAKAKAVKSGTTGQAVNSGMREIEHCPQQQEGPRANALRAGPGPDAQDLD